MTSGTWGISNNQLAQTDPISSGVPTVRSASALAQADYQISSQLTPLTGGGYVGLAARYVDANNHYFLRLRVDTNNVSLYRVQGGTFSLLGSAPAPSPALALGQTYHLRLTV
ncbi:MAG: hypothetical protein HY737_02965, partial [Candidatus Omnitrophica bacterium]|nr:hypothetical protein [Candidatus Omnitrophota bacterium]